MQLWRKVLLAGSPALQKEIKEKITELEIKLYAVRKAVME